MDNQQQQGEADCENRSRAYPVGSGAEEQQQSNGQLGFRLEHRGAARGGQLGVLLLAQVSVSVVAENDDYDEVGGDLNPHRAELGYVYDTKVGVIGQSALAVCHEGVH